MKVGDKVYCKKSYTKISNHYLGSKVIIYLEGGSYKIVSMSDYVIDIYSVTMNKSYTFRFNSKAGFLSDICPLFGKYFVTASEIRRQKLEKLNLL